MKTTFLQLSVLFFFVTVCVNNAISQGSGEINGYKLVWQDEFCGPTLNPSVWNIEVRNDGGGNNELQYYTNRPDNVSIGIEPVSGKSCLILTAKKETYGTGGNQRTCTSGRVTTQGKMSVQYGKIEASIKLPKTANGLWPAFWMLGSNISSSGFGWPTCGEIDILEMGNAQGITAGTQERYFNGALHWGYYTGGNYPNYGYSVTNAYSLQDDFHLYTCEWDANSIKMYLDKDKYPGVAPYYQMNISGTNDDRGGQYAGYNYFRHPFFVIFNLAIGGNFPGIFNINNITALNAGDAKMYIDFIKVYQKGDAGENYIGPALVSDEDCDGGDPPKPEEIVCTGNNFLPATLTMGTSYFAPWWVPSTNHNAAYANNELTLRLGDATDAGAADPWQAQFPLVCAETALISGKSYFLSFDIETDKALPRVFMKVYRNGLDDNYVETRSQSVPAGKTTVKGVYVSSTTGFNKILFEFTGNPANTNIKISNIQVCGEYGTGDVVSLIDHEDGYNSGIEITQSKDGIYIFAQENLQAVELYSISGQLMRRQTNNIVQTAGIPKGIYVLRVIELSGNQRTFKVIIY